MGPRFNSYGLRLSAEEKEFLKQESLKLNKPVSEILREGMELYFELHSEINLKRKGYEVWKE